MDSVAGAAIEIDDVTTMDIAAGSVSIEAMDAGLGAYLEHPRTPRTEYSPSVAVRPCSVPKFSKKISRFPIASNL